MPLALVVHPCDSYGRKFHERIRDTVREVGDNFVLPLKEEDRSENSHTQFWRTRGMCQDLPLQHTMSSETIEEAVQEAVPYLEKLKANSREDGVSFVICRSPEGLSEEAADKQKKAIEDLKRTGFRVVTVDGAGNFDLTPDELSQAIGELVNKDSKIINNPSFTRYASKGNKLLSH